MINECCCGCMYNHNCNGKCIYKNNKSKDDKEIKPTLQSVIRSLQRKQYVECMKNTEYGWKARGKYKGISCPSDLPFISMKDEPHPDKCIVDCKECWEYVLKNKWK